MLDGIQIHIAEHCNLKCKYCVHFSCIAEPEFLDIDKFKKDIARLCFLTNGKVEDIILIGGEPLLNPDICKYTNIARKYFTESRISIYTNGILLNSMKASFWKNLSKNDIILVPTIYPVNIDWIAVIKKCEKYNIKFQPWSSVEYNIKAEDIDKLRRNEFTKFVLSEKILNLDNSHCAMRCCTCLDNGKIYFCSLCAYIRHYNKKFGTNFKHAEDDFVDIYKIDNIEQINNFLDGKHSFCKHCIPFIYTEKWECSQEHSISEWSL